MEMWKESTSNVAKNCVNKPKLDAIEKQGDFSLHFAIYHFQIILQLLLIYVSVFAFRYLVCS